MVSVYPTNIIFFHISSFIYYESLKYYRALQLSTWGKVLTYFFPDLVFFTWQLHSTLLILFRNFIPTPIISSSNDGSMDSSQTRASGSNYSPPSSSQMMPIIVCWGWVLLQKKRNNGKLLKFKKFNIKQAFFIRKFLSSCVKVSTQKK